MRAQKSQGAVGTALLLCLLACIPSTVRGEEFTLPPDVVELFEMLGIEVDSNGVPVPPPPSPTPPPPSPTPPAPAPEVDPLAFLAELGISVDAITEPSPPPAAPEPTPIDVEPPTISQAEIDLFAQLGLILDENGNVVPAAPQPPPTVIDTEAELEDFLASVGIVLDEQGIPVPPSSVPPAPTADPLEFLANLGLDVETPAAPAASVASSTSIPEPTTALLVLGGCAGLLACRRR